MFAIFLRGMGGRGGGIGEDTMAYVYLHPSRGSLEGGGHPLETLGPHLSNSIALLDNLVIDDSELFCDFLRSLHNAKIP